MNAATAIPLPRPADNPPPLAVSVRSLAEVDRDLGDLAVREARHREMLAGARRALIDLAAQRELLLEQRRRAIAVAVHQLDAGQLTAAG